MYKNQKFGKIRNIKLEQIAQTSEKQLFHQSRDN